MKTFLSIFFTIISLVCLSQNSLDEPYIKWSLQMPVISSIDLRTGKNQFSTSLKENPIQIPLYSKEKKAIYAVTKHYSYKIDGKSGEILIEYKYTDILVQESDDKIDPNLLIALLHFDSKGEGLFYNMDEEVQNRANYLPPTVTLRKFSTEDKSTFDFGLMDKDQYSTIQKTNGSFYLINNIKPGDKSVNVYKCRDDRFEITETIKIDIEMDGEEFDLSSTSIEQVLLKQIQNNHIQLQVTIIDSATKDILIYYYTYDLTEKQPVSMTESSIALANEMKNIQVAYDCKKAYEQVINTPDLTEIPKAPEYILPESKKKKEIAEIDEINAKNMKEWKIKMAEWQDKVANFIDYSSTDLYSINGNEKTLIKSFEGVCGVTIWEDRYVWYMDALEDVMLDLESNQIIWSLLR